MRYSIQNRHEFVNRIWAIVMLEFEEIGFCQHWWDGPEQFDDYWREIVTLYENAGWHACMNLAIRGAAKQIAEICFHRMPEEEYIENAAYLRAVAVLDGRE